LHLTCFCFSFLMGWNRSVYFSYSCSGAVPYNKGLLEGLSCCLGMTLFPISLLPWADGHGGVVSAALGGELRRGFRPCCTSADCTARSSSSVDISVSFSIKSFSFPSLCLVPANNSVHERKSSYEAIRLRNDFGL
jgi:hypothetical protein